jgi:hypothetical protein
VERPAFFRQVRTAPEKQASPLHETIKLSRAGRDDKA